MNPRKFSIADTNTKADKRHTLGQMTRYYQEAGHSKQTARAHAKKYLRYGKI